ncbi:hypothetical protein A2397_03850 [Candidatus Amesbacteria bacterium RIFOXYB1_FULL_44_23]|uniref:Uncharacterized protein n=1 Tax=Candidatus Amesbacteria bacterium RIFOXYB1_FULL_44_23 TaxID=1797263 RepID=A0A1F4ZV39_9BACT|nr:MAG: hypothetical protein A2397_03850 [Candidatus Amesbacteria bacterium RIFOXYB1_FULL_44_23]
MNNLLADTINLVNTTGPYQNIYGLRPSAYVQTGINMMLGASGVLAFIYLLMGGMQWITSSGDKDAAEKARKKIMYALVGLSITFSSYALLYIVRILFGVNLVQVVINNIGAP